MRVMTTFAVSLLLALSLVHVAGAAETIDPAADRTVASASTVDIRDLIVAVGNKSHIRFLIDPRIKAGVDLGNVTSRDVTYPVLLSILQIYGFAVIPEGDIKMVVIDANVRTMAPPLVSPDNIKGEDAEIVTTIIGLSSASAATLAPTLRPLVAQYGHLTALPGRNALLLTDRVLNVKRLVTIIREVDKLPAQPEAK